MSQCRQLPVQHGQHARLAGMKNQIVEAVITVDDARLIVGWNVFRQPGDEIIHRLNLFRLRSAVLLRPAIDLAREVTPALAIVPKTDGAIIDPMEGGDY